MSASHFLQPTYTATRHTTGGQWTVRPWDETEDMSLRQFWAEGVTVARIAVAVGRTVNAVVGRVKRLKLTPRPSPIVRKPGAKPKAKPHKPKVVRVSPPAPPDPPASRPAMPVRLPPPVQPPTRAAAFPAVRSCQYPRGERPRWDWCGAPVVPGRPYCLIHERICWVSPPRARAA